MTDFIAGALSGLSQTIVGHPFDTLKVRLQDNMSIKNMKYKHYFRGLTYPLLSSGIINAICFGVHNRCYKKNKNNFLSGLIAGAIISPIVHITNVGKIKRQVGLDIKPVDFIKSKGLYSTFAREMVAFSTYFSTYHYLREKNYNVFVCGGLSGLANWTLSYPIDVIRTRQYAQNIGILEAIAMKHYWKGYSMCASRAIIVNAVGFWVFEKFK